MIIDPLQDGKSQIQLIDWMGGDLSVVNDARASFNKESTGLTDKDIKLINYLARENHLSPFRGVIFKFKVKAPLFVCRQWWKHHIASTHSEEQDQWNETSLRYVEIADPAEFYIPDKFRLQSKNNKQATEGFLNEESNEIAKQTYHRLVANSYMVYQELLMMGVGREQARGILVPAVYTTWTWTVSLQALLHFIGLRKGHGAQVEISLYADAIFELVKDIVPETIKAWELYGNNF